MWRYMGGRSIGHLTLNNTRLYLFAVQNISIEIASGKEKSNLQRIETGVKIGKVNLNGDIFLDKTNDIPHLHRKFKQFHLNRV